MKPPVGIAKPARKRTRLTAVRAPRRLDLRQVPVPDHGEQPTVRSPFWKWVAIIALVHLVIIAGFALLRPQPQPPEPFISLLPTGDVVHGSPGAQQAPTAAPTTSSAVARPASAMASPPPPAPAPTPSAPVPKAMMPKPAPTPVPKPAPPPVPKVKVDLHLVERVDDATPAPAKPKHVKKTHHIAKTEPAADHDQAAAPDTTGLSREEIAAQLGKKLEAEGVQASQQAGTSGSTEGSANRFADFYASIRDQVMNKWITPNLTDQAQQPPVVMIHVESDGRVPPELVSLKQSSGNAVYDQSALEAARSIGYTLQPLPDGCPPDITINFKLNP